MLTAIPRREFLATSAAGLTTWSHPKRFAAPRRRPRVAAIYTVFRFRSHAFDFLENFFRPFLFNGQLVDPGVEVVSMYTDQIAPEGDMTRDVSRRFNVPLCPTIADALTLGTGTLAVDAVLSVVEHGNYPINSRGVVMYPRKQFFDQAVCVMQRSQRFVPIFNDKHLSFRWDWARQMYDVAQSCGIPLMAGSSVPLGSRNPAWELPPHSDIDEALAIHGGGVESYDFHGLELLQSFVEARRGGETGIASIEFLTGEALLNAAKSGRWSRELADAAMRAEQELNAGPRGIGKSFEPVKFPIEPVHGLLVTYCDGLRATVLKVGNSSNRWNFACRLKGDPQVHATAIFNGPWGNRNFFKALSHAVQHFFRDRQAPYPIQRTLLVSGALEAALWSRELKGCPIATPHLHLKYSPRDFRAFRETGASWKVLTPDIPESKGFEPGDGDVVRSHNAAKPQPKVERN